MNSEDDVKPSISAKPVVSALPYVHVILRLAVLVLFLGLVASHVQAESAATFLRGKAAQVRICNSADTDQTICEHIALALTGSSSELSLIAPDTVAPSITDTRVAELGRSCPSTGTDAKGDPYLPFELEYDGWQALPVGPFEFFDLGSYYAEWRGYQIVTAAGYDYENARLSTGQPLLWKGYYLVQTGKTCPLILIHAFYHRGREQTSPQLVGENLYVWRGRVLLANIQEQPIGTGRLYVTVSLIPSDPTILENSKAHRTIVTFIAQ